MINLGTVRPGSTIYIPFETFAGSTGAPIALTGLAAGDIKVYKDGGTTERASTSGFTLLDTDGIDFDGLTGIHGVSIDLSDDTTAGFWTAGSRYFVVIGDVTVDSQTMRFVAATFRLGYESAVLDTTIATLSSQTSFTLTNGPADDNALNDLTVIIHQKNSAVRWGRATVSAYTGASKTVTLAAGTTFTAAAGDNISIMGPAPMQPATAGRKPVVDASGLVDATMVKAGASGSAASVTATTSITFPSACTVATTTGAVGSVTGAVGSVTAAVTVGTNNDKTGYGLSAAAVQAIWDAATSALTTAGSIGKYVVDNIGTLLLRITSSRAGYLDNLNVGGNVASSAEVSAIQNNTRCSIAVPEVIERPDSGTSTYRIEVCIYDEVGNMEAPDSAPTIALVNQAGTDLSARLSSTTMSLVSTGRYRVTYTADAADALEQLIWAFSIVEGGQTRIVVRNSIIVDTTAVDFTAADRTKLDRLDTDYTTARAAKIDNLDATVSSRLATAGYTAPDNATISTISTNVTTVLGRIGAFTGSGVNNILGFFRALLLKSGLVLIPSDIGSTYDNTTDSLEAIRDRGDAAWGASGSAPQVLVDTDVANVVDQTHFELTAAIGGNNTYKDQTVVFYDASGSNAPSVRKITAFADASNAITIDSAPDFTVVAGDGVKIFVTPPGTTAPTAAQVADQVWDELEADHQSAGTMGRKMREIRQGTYGKEVTDQANRTRKIYDIDGTTLLLTQTASSSADGKTITETPS